MIGSIPKINICPDDIFLEILSSEIRPYLAERRTSSTFTNNNHQIYYEHYLPRSGINHLNPNDPNNNRIEPPLNSATDKLQPVKATVVIVHGFCGFGRKYEEMIYLFLQQGYEVFIADNFGHGLSDRGIRGNQPVDTSLVDVDDYSTYVEDLHYLIKNIILKSSSSKSYHDEPTSAKPLFLLGHSMGGAIVGLFMAQYPDLCRAAVLSSPMFAINFGKYPLCLVEFLCKIQKIFHSEFEFAPKQHPFTSVPDFINSSCSENNHYMAIFNQRLREIKYRTHGGSWRWLGASIKAIKKLKRTGKNISCPVLILQAGEDSLVPAEGLLSLAQKIPNHTIYCLPGCKHELYNATAINRQTYYAQIFSFLENQN